MGFEDATHLSNDVIMSAVRSPQCWCAVLVDYKKKIEEEEAEPFWEEEL